MQVPQAAIEVCTMYVVRLSQLQDMDQAIDANGTAGRVPSQAVHSCNLRAAIEM